MIEHKFEASWEGLVKAIEKEIPKILVEDVAPYVWEVLKKHIETDIYDAYTPKPGAWVHGTTYQRRHMLNADENKVVLMEGKDTVVVTSGANASPSVVKGYSFRNRYSGSFLALIESGNTGIWRGGFPRPAVANTEAELDKSNEFHDMIDEALYRRLSK